MAVEAPAPAPETMSVPDSVELPSSAHQEADFTIWEQELAGEAKTINIANTNFFEALLGQESEYNQDSVSIYAVPEQAISVIEDKLPSAAQQNAAIVSLVYEIENIAPQFLGWIMGSGRTWWFVTFEEAMEIDPDYVAGFAKGYVQEKMWQYTAF